MSKKILAHYTNGNDLLDSIHSGLKSSGKSLHSITTVDLAAVDEFHIRGRKATLELAEAMDLTSDSLVLDIGCGIGGPARTVAETYGSRVIGIDLSQTFCSTAEELAAWTSLNHLVAFRQSDASELPFEDSYFNAAFTIHVGMNIADKSKMYTEAHRVLMPGGIFAIYDVLKGDGGDVYFPVPWAPDESVSFLATPDEMRQLLTEAGFRIIDEKDSSQEGYEWFVSALRRIEESGLPPLSLRTLLGEEFPVMMKNIARSLEEQRALVRTFICQSQAHQDLLPS